MPVAFVAELPGMTTEIYDRVMDNLNWGPGNLPSGFISHYATEAPGGLFVFDVWEKAEDWQRFAEEQLGAALEAATGGPAPAIEPRFYPIYREEHR
jgi:hypothetical protein